MRKVVATNVELSADIRAMLERLCRDDLRTLKGEIEWMIKQRYRERYGQTVGPVAPQSTEEE